MTSLPIRVIKTDLAEGEIIDVQKNGKEIGEIVCVGNICAKGYYKDAEATRKLFAGGVLHTGDLVSVKCYLSRILSDLRSAGCLA